ncbi:MAG: Ig-like domain-containing protein [Cyanobacteria bacterium P01_F01_bin.150]
MLEFSTLFHGNSSSAVHDPLYLASDWLGSKPESGLLNRQLFPISESAARLEALMAEMLEDGESLFDGTFKPQRSPITPTMPFVPLSAAAFPQSQVAQDEQSAQSSQAAQDELTGQTTNQTIVGTAAVNGADLELEILINDQPVDDTSDLGIQPGESVRWTYRVTNAGTVAFAEEDVVVRDSYIDLTPQLDPGSDVGGDRLLAPGETWEYTTITTAAELSVVWNFETDSFGNSLSRGTVIDDELAAHGLTLSTPNHPYGAMIFDSGEPTGGDLDLGTPHRLFGGPGKGAGGRPGEPGENRVALGNVLIISEDGDQQDPDDNAKGGTLRFSWDAPVQVSHVGILDIDKKEVGGAIATYNTSGERLDRVTIANLGGNSVQTIDINQDEVSYLDVNLKRSGAVYEIGFEQTFRNVVQVEAAGVVVTAEGSYQNNPEDTVPDPPVDPIEPPIDPIDPPIDPIDPPIDPIDPPIDPIDPPVDPIDPPVDPIDPPIDPPVDPIDPNELPVAEGDSYTLDEDTILTIDAAGVLGNDTDADGDVLTAELGEGAQNGTLTLNADGSFSYEPNINFSGEDRFTYRANDGEGASEFATVALTVNPVNDAPELVVPGIQSVESEADLAIAGLQITDIDAEAGELSVSISATEGLLSLAQVNGLTFTIGDGVEDGAIAFTGTLEAINQALASLTYRSVAGFEGQDTISLVVNDQGNSGAGGALEGTGAIALVVGDTNRPILSAVLANDTGINAEDSITSNPAISGTVNTSGAISEFRAGFDGTPADNFVDVLATLQPDGRFLLDVATLTAINNGTALPDGVHTLKLIATDAAGNVSDVFEFEFTLDTTAPTVFAGRVTESDTTLDVAFDEAVSAAAFAAENYSLIVANGNNAGTSIEVVTAEQVNERTVRLSFDSPLTTNVSYTLAIDSAIHDLAGNALAPNTSLDISVDPPTIELHPIHGEERVALNRKTVIRFEKEVDPSTVTEETIYLIANGEKLLGRLEVSSTNKFATFIPTEPLPASTEVRVMVNGDEIKTLNGVAFDGDLDGLAGGMATADFTTVPLTRIEGSNIFGYVYDSYNRNPDGSDKPVVGATIRVDGLPDVFAVTDENGYFKLEDLPAPDVYVFIDGSTATEAPEGTQYASLGKPFHSVPGQEVQLKMDGEPFDIYLLPMAMGDVKALSETEETPVGFGAGALALLQETLPEVDSSVWKAVEVKFPAGSARDDAGNAATQAMIVPVDPERLPAPPPAHLDPKLVISIQAGGENGFNREADGGSTYFDVPAPVVFPNLDGLAAGEKATLFSFDHEAGHWLPIGLGTVSEDGSVIKSDPGVGILAPGWHFVVPEVTWGMNVNPPEEDTPFDKDIDLGVEVKLFASGDADVIRLEFPAPPGVGAKVGQHEFPQGDQTPVRDVNIIIRGPFDEFYDNSGANKIVNESFRLFPGDRSVIREATLRDLASILAENNGGRPFDKDVLYGAQIIITDILTLADGSKVTSRQTKIPYLYVDQSDAKFNDANDRIENTSEDMNLAFADTLVVGDITQTRDFELRIGDIPNFKAPKPDLIFEGGNAGDFIGSSDEEKLSFNPSSKGEKTSILKAKVTVEGQKYRSLAGIEVKGNGQDIQELVVNTDDLENALGEINIQFRLESIFSGRDARTYTLTFNGETTDPIRYDAGPDVIKAELLEAAIRATQPPFAIPDVNDISVINPLKRDRRTRRIIRDTSVFEIEFKGSLAGTAHRITGTPSLGSPHLEIEQTVSVAEWELVNTQNERFAIANKVMERLNFLFDGFRDGLRVVDNANGNNQITLDWERSSRTGRLGTSSPGGIDNKKATKTVASEYLNYTETIQNFLIDEAINQNLNATVKVFVDTFFEGHDLTTKGGNSEEWIQSLVNAIAKTAAHEAGHSLGARHTYKRIQGRPYEVVHNRVLGRTDIMKSGSDFDGNLMFRDSLTADILRLALNLEWTSEQAQNALENYVKHFAERADGFDTDDDFDEGVFDFDDSEFDLLEGAVLAIENKKGDLLTDGSVNFIPLMADLKGGGERIINTLRLRNIANEDLILTGFVLEDDSESFSLTPITPYSTILPGDSLSIEVEFAPASSGDIRGKLLIESNSNGSSLNIIELNGFGLDSDPTFKSNLLSQNNNFGGTPIGSATQIDQFLTITNNGAVDLTFTPTILKGQADFSLGDFEGVEQTLAFNETLTIPVTFSPTANGLRPGLIQFTTNDPDQPTFTQGIVGTGIPDGPLDFDWGNDFVAIEYNDFLQRTTSNDAGSFMFELPTFDRYDISIFDPDSGLIAQSGGFTGPAGALTDLTTGLTFRPSEAPDTDFDGLPDDIEFAIGTDITKADTDGDGLSDFTEINNGLNAVNGQGFPTGVIASLPLRGEANAVVVEGSTLESRDQLAYIATGSYGLAIVDASEFDNPIILGQLDLPGNATDVAVDPTLNIAAVVTQNGLQLVDVSDPMMPELIQTVEINAFQVEVFDGLAYATVGGTLQTIDLLTGEITDSLSVSSALIETMAREGSYLYTYARNSFSVIDTAQKGGAAIVNSIPVDAGRVNNYLSVGNGIAYLTGFGFQTFDVSDPNNIKPTSARDLSLPSKGIALNGSGLAVIAGEAQGASIFDVTDPGNTGALLTQIDTPGNANDVAIASGIAYVADGTGGLQVINYRPFDTQGQAPELTISSGLIDVDPNTPGLQVFEGSTIPIQVDALDDVQVRNVELLVNGEVVRNDVSFPFDFEAIALNDDETFVEVQVRATDTGGNSTLSNLLTIDLIPDTFAPEIEAITPVDGSEIARNLRRVTVRFNEAIDAADITTDNFQLRTADGELLTPENIQLRDDDKLVQLTYKPLAAGDYTLVIDGDDVSDRAGNALGTSDITSAFSLIESTIFWIGDSGNWSDRSNWSTGELPGREDIVSIDVPGDATITVNARLGTIANLFSNEHIEFIAGDLTITADSELTNGISLKGGRFVNNGLTILDGNSVWTGGTLERNGEVINQGEITISGASEKKLSTTLKNEGTLIHAGTLTFTNGELINTDSGLYDFRSGTIETQRFQTGIFKNSGTVQKSTDNAATISAFDTMGGTLDIQEGTLKLQSGNLTDGLYTVEEDSTLIFGGNYTLNDGSRITGQGTTRLDLGKGRIVVAGSSSNASIETDQFEFMSGSLTANGTLTVTGETIWAAGTLGGDGFTNQGQLTSTGSSPKFISGLARNEGTWIHQDGALSFNNGELANLGSGLFDLQSGTITIVRNKSGVFTNGGSLQKTTDSVATIWAIFDNQSGSVDVEAGTLQFQNNSTNNGSNIVTADSVLEFARGTHRFLDGYSVTGDGRVLLSNGTLDVSSDGGASFGPNIEQRGGTIKET